MGSSEASHPPTPLRSSARPAAGPRVPGRPPFTRADSDRRNRGNAGSRLAVRADGQEGKSGAGPWMGGGLGQATSARSPRRAAAHAITSTLSSSPEEHRADSTLGEIGSQDNQVDSGLGRGRITDRRRVCRSQSWDRPGTTWPRTAGIANLQAGATAGSALREWRSGPTRPYRGC